MSDLISQERTSRLHKYLASERPGIPAVMFCIVALVAVVGILELLEPGASALRVTSYESDTSKWASLITLILLWPSTTLMTHGIAGYKGFQAPFPRALHIIGKAWILQLFALIILEGAVVALVSIGWTTLADWVYIFVRGYLPWILLYPFVIESIYGPSARSIQVTFYLVFVVLLIALSMLTLFSVSFVVWLVH